MFHGITYTFQQAVQGYPRETAGCVCHLVQPLPTRPPSAVACPITAYNDNRCVNTTMIQRNGVCRPKSTRRKALISSVRVLSMRSMQPRPSMTNARQVIALAQVAERHEHQTQRHQVRVGVARSRHHCGNATSWLSNSSHSSVHCKTHIRSHHGVPTAYW